MRTLWLALALTIVAICPAGAKTALPDYPQTTPYATVRSELLARGYAPAHVPNQVSEDCHEHAVECRRYPELWRCFYSIDTPCNYVWRAPDGTLLLVSAGVGTTEHETWLDDKIRLATADERKLMFAPQHSPFPKFKRHTPYGEVRKSLIKLGYKPLRIADPESTDCDVFQDRCRRYPEMEACSETGAGFCQFFFRAPNGRSIIVQTMGETPGFHLIYYASREDVRAMKRHLRYRSY